MMKSWFCVLVLVMSVGISGCASFNPAPVQTEPIVGKDQAPVLAAGQKVKVLCWNVQYMAGTNYIFFYDVLDESGPDTRPSAEDITKTIEDVAKVIRRENPDIILLQEVDDGSKRTDYEDQLERLLKLLPADYACHSSAFYHKAAFVPHPKIMGRVGLKLSTISKYQISQSSRHQLALKRVGYLRKKFDLKRAVLETRLPVRGGKDFVVMNTHLEAFAQGEDTMQRQVRQVRDLLDTYAAEGHACIVGGDFNLLPPGSAYHALPAYARAYYQEETELEVLTGAYPCIPSLADVNGPERHTWFTHFANNTKDDPSDDRTIDYIFYTPDLSMENPQVLQEGMLHISDHMPLVAEFVLPE